MSISPAPDEKQDTTTMAGNLSSGISTAQAAVTLLATLGTGALIQSLWARATLTYDQRFLLDLEAHQRALGRADQIDAAATTRDPDTQASVHDPATQATMRDLATTLRTQADRALRYAIARARWQNSRTRDWGIGCLVIVLLVVVIASPVYLSVPSKWQGLVLTLSTGAAALATAIGMFILTFYKDFFWFPKNTP